MCHFCRYVFLRMSHFCLFLLRMHHFHQSVSAVQTNEQEPHFYMQSCLFWTNATSADLFVLRMRRF